MIEKLKYIVAGSMVLALSTSFVACSDDETEPDKWTSSYVYLERASLGVGVTQFKVRHSSEGIVGDVKLPIVVKLSKACPSDVTVTLQGAMKDSPETQTLVKVIPAGELFVRDTVQFTNWDFAVGTKTAAEYQGAVTITDLQMTAKGWLISPTLKSSQFVVNKSFQADIFPNEKPLGARIADRSKWIISWTDTEGAEAPWEVAATSMVDDRGRTYEESYTGYLGFSVDLGSVQKVTGIESYCYYNDWCAASSCTIEISTDGVKWTNLIGGKKVALDPTAEQYLAFAKEVSTRYIRWHMYGGDNVVSSELYLWAK